MIKLPKQFRRDWINALRSGEYKQGEGVLLDFSEEENTFCCLGVACKIIGFDDEDIAGIELPEYIDEDIDLAGEFPYALLDTSFITFLASLNDGDSFTPNSTDRTLENLLQELGLYDKYVKKRTKLNFNEIADLIELITEDEE